MLGDDGRHKSDGSGCLLISGNARLHCMNGGDPAAPPTAFPIGMPGNSAIFLAGKRQVGGVRQ